MNYEIRSNAQFNSNEIYFDGKPGEAVRDALKTLRFRWHSIKKCWYGFADANKIAAAIDESLETKRTEEKKPAEKPQPVNKYGVKVGDIFSASWGYDQTNNDFFQVIALVGESSVRVREVYLPMIDSSAVGPMAENRTFEVTRKLLPAFSNSVFIKDQEKGDLKRLKSYAADGKSNPQFTLSSFCNAHYCGGDKITVYESWYA